MLKNYYLALVPIFVAVDALGVVPMYLAMTHGMAEYEKDRLILKSTLTALCVAILFLWLGNLVFSWHGITMSDFLVAGGAILFIISIRDLLSYSKGHNIPAETVGVIPLAVPLIAGPAVLTTSLILLNSLGILPTLFSVVVNILLCGIILHYARHLSKLLGETGSHTLSKIFNLLLGAIGVMLVRRGVEEIIRSFASVK